MKKSEREPEDGQQPQHPQQQPGLLKRRAGGAGVSVANGGQGFGAATAVGGKTTSNTAEAVDANKKKNRSNKKRGGGMARRLGPSSCEFGWRWLLLLGVLVVCSAWLWVGPSLRLLQAFETAQSVQVAVFGGTGSQGGAAIDYLVSGAHGLRIPEENIRVLTRNLSSAASRRLLEKHPGLKLIEGSPHDPQALDRLLQGAHGVFGITFSDPRPGFEFKTGVALAEAVARHRDTITTFVFSGGMRTGIEGLDVKADIQQVLLQQLGDSPSSSASSMEELAMSIPCQTYLHTSFFYENLVLKGSSLRVSLEGDGYVFRAPLDSNLTVPMVSSMDIGRVAGHILLHTQLPPSTGRITHHRPKGQRHYLLETISYWISFALEELHLIPCFTDCRSSRSMGWCSQVLRAPSDEQQLGGVCHSVHEIPLVGGKVSGPSFAAEFSSAVSLPARYEAVPLELLMKGIDPKDLQRLKAMYNWYAQGGGSTTKMSSRTREEQILDELVRSLPNWMKEYGAAWIQSLVANSARTSSQ